MRHYQLRQQQLLCANTLEQLKIYNIFKNYNKTINLLNQRLRKFFRK